MSCVPMAWLHCSIHRRGGGRGIGWTAKKIGLISAALARLASVLDSLASGYGPLIMMGKIPHLQGFMANHKHLSKQFHCLNASRGLCFQGGEGVSKAAGPNPYDSIHSLKILPIANPHP